MSHTLSLLPLLLVVSTLLFFLVWSISHLLGERMPHLRLVLWAIVLVRLFIPPAVLTAWTVESSWLAPPAHELLSIPLNEALTSPAAMDPSEQPGDWFEPLLVSLWAGGAAIAFGRWLVARRRRVLRVSRTARSAGPEVLDMLEEWKSQLRIRRNVSLVVSSETPIAFTTGVLRPTIYLPAEMETRLSRAALSTVVAHELAHVKRCDDLWLMLETLVRSVYVFHPVAWFATAQLRGVREQLTDELVIDRGGIDGRRYGATLLDTVSLQVGTTEMPALVERSARALERRLVRLANHQRPRSRRLAIAAGFVAIVLLLPTGLRAESSPSEVTPTLRHPLPGARITSTFGPRLDPFSDAQSIHRGVDLAASRDTLVLAAAPGVVISATEHYEASPDQGTVVLIRHGDQLHTFSSHLGRLLVSEGETVAAGQPIAHVGSTGRVTGPHLHFEVIIGQQPVDPMPLIEPGVDE